MGRLGHGAIDRPERVIPEVLAGNLVLWHAALCGELRCEMGEEAGVGHQAQADRWSRRGEQPPHLGCDALAREMLDELGAVADRRQRRRLDLEPERRRQPHRAHHPQRVLAEASRRVADGTEGTDGQVLAAPERIDEARFAAGLRAPRDRVHGEIASRKVELDRVAELDPVGAAIVGVLMIGSESRDLDLTDCAVVRPDRDGPELVLVDRAGKEFRGHLGQRRARQIPVLGGAIQQRVAQRATDHVRGVAGGPQRPKEIVDGGGDRRGWIDRGAARVERQFRPRNR
jgi:hypothetical protein